MKKSLTRILALALIAATAVHCTDDGTDKDGALILSLSPMDATMGSFANSTTHITIRVAEGYTCTAEVLPADRSWLVASIEGDQLTLKALTANIGSARKGFVNVVAQKGGKNVSKKASVTQQANAALPTPLAAEPYKWSNHQDKLYYPFMTDYTGSLNPTTATFSQGKTRIVPYLIGFSADSTIVRYRSVTNKYGSRTDKARHTATGHFYTKRIDGRWFFIDPEGYIHHHHGVTSVRKGSSSRNSTAWNTKYGTDANWMKSIQQELADIGVHGTGAFCSDTYSTIQAHNTANPSKPMALCPSFGFLAQFRRQIGASPGGKTSNDVGLMFYPGWKDFCKTYLQEVLAPYKDDPNTIGFYSDNELLFTDDNNAYITHELLKITDPTNPARKAVEDWMATKGITSTGQIFFATNGEFAGIIADLYYKGVREALDELGYKKLYFGSRLHGNPKGIESVIKAAGRYCDVISINLYGYWDITNRNVAGETSRVYDWHQWTDTPFFISEFYTRAKESDLANTSGGGYLVKTFMDRAYAYQHITLGLIESPNCVGWTWFKYQDDDGSDNSNKPANKGIYDNYYNMYPELSSYMKAVNVNAFELIEYFDGKTY